MTIADWIESNASKLEAKFGRNETQGYMYCFVSRTSFSIARHYGGCKINGAYYDYIPDGDLLVREDVLRWIRKEMKKQASV